MNVGTWFVSLRKKWRKHQFDLEYPTFWTCGKFTFPRYTCSRCGKTLGLDRRDMEDLPSEMARGCPG